MVGGISDLLARSEIDYLAAEPRPRICQEDRVTIVLVLHVEPFSQRFRRGARKNGGRVGGAFDAETFGWAHM